MQIGPAAGKGVTLLEFEHDVLLDTDGYPSPEDILNRQVTEFDSLDDALAALSARGIDTDLFDAPWKMDYPM